jgi:hypothetical protein
MNLALAHNTAVDPHEAWLETHGAAWCHRLIATITIATCEVNRARLKSYYSDCRCAGCNGLNDQPGPGLSFLPAVMLKDPEPGEDPVEILESGNSPVDADVDFDDVELDLDDEALLALFPELYEGDNDADYPSFTAYQTPMSRYAVYKGRCKRCGGYMNNFREWHDDNVFRCLACGWRTSPEYEQNRMLLTSGMNG